MSLILSEKSEQAVYKVKRLEEGIRCDICNKFIKADKRRSSEDTNKYYEVTTGHEDWGNDSVDSIEHQDICPDCIDNFVIEYLKTTKYRTAYITIDTSHTYPRLHWDDRKVD